MKLLSHNRIDQLVSWVVMRQLEYWKAPLSLQYGEPAKVEPSAVVHQRYPLSVFVTMLIYSVVGMRFYHVR